MADEAMVEARDAVLLIAYDPCWWATGTEPASEYLCAIDDAHLCDRCRNLGAALDWLVALAEARGAVEGHGVGCTDPVGCDDARMLQARLDAAIAEVLR